MARVQYRIYVVELSKKVFSEHRRFRDANPQFNGVLECLYVGMTSKTPKERLEQHKTGFRNAKGHKLSSNIVEKYGKYLRPSLYNHIPPLSNRSDALETEERLALQLRRKGYAVWFN
jgi:predicted GIY-YIG superfamily endonuclease